MITIMFLAAAATVMANFPNWKIAKTKDLLTDKDLCTGYYRGRTEVQLNSDALYILTKISPTGVILRFGEQPPQPFRLARREEQELRSVIIRIGKLRAPREMADHEAELKKLQAEYEQRRELYYQGRISRDEVIQSESAVAKAMILVDEDKSKESDVTYDELAQIKRLRYRVSTILNTIVEGDVDLKDVAQPLELVRSEKCTR